MKFTTNVFKFYFSSWRIQLQRVLYFFSTDPLMNVCTLHLITRSEKLLKISDRIFLIEISSELKSKIRIKFLNTRPAKKEVQIIKEFLTEWFDLSADLKPFYKFAGKDKLLREIVKKYYGLRLIGIPDIFEAITWAIIGQQINLSFAYKLKRNFVERYGENYSYENKTYFLYPTAEIISKIKRSELLKLQFSKQKADYVIETAKTLEGYEVSSMYKQNLSELSLTDAKDKLCGIHGVGNWTANYALMKCIRNPDAFPLEDVGLHNAIKNILNLSSKPSIESIKKIIIRLEWLVFLFCFFISGDLCCRIRNKARIGF